MKASQLSVENTQDIAVIVSLYWKEDYDFADLMIHQAASRGGNGIIKTFDQKFIKLDGVHLLGKTHLNIFPIWSSNQSQVTLKKISSRKV